MLCVSESRTSEPSAVAAATLRDAAGDVRAGDLDLTSVSVAKTSGNLVVRFTVRKPITDNVVYTASVKQGTGSWALVARRGGGDESFTLFDLSSGLRTAVSGTIAGRTATISAPILMLGQTDATLGRVQAYFRAEPANGRNAQTDSVATTVSFSRPRSSRSRIRVEYAWSSCGSRWRS